MKYGLVHYDMPSSKGFSVHSVIHVQENKVYSQHHKCTLKINVVLNKRDR